MQRMLSYKINRKMSKSLVVYKRISLTAMQIPKTVTNYFASGELYSVHSNPSILKQR